jgi:hypothetical protein
LKLNTVAHTVLRERKATVSGLLTSASITPPLSRRGGFNLSRCVDRCYSKTACSSKRNTKERSVCGGSPGALNIPLPELRGRLDELPRDREILIFCRSGQRAYYAMRISSACVQGTKRGRTNALTIARTFVLETPGVPFLRREWFAFGKTSGLIDLIYPLTNMGL